MFFGINKKKIVLENIIKFHNLVPGPLIQSEMTIVNESDDTDDNDALPAIRVHTIY